jgi:hypothetical protein
MTCNYDYLTTTSTVAYPPNLWDRYSFVASQSGRHTVTDYPSNPPQGFWGNSSSWRCANFWCTSDGSNVSASLISYTIYEHGSDTGKRIYPPSAGAPGWSLSSSRKLTCDSNVTGYIESEGSGFYDWFMGYSPFWDSNTYADIAYSKNINASRRSRTSTARPTTSRSRRAAARRRAT